MMQRMVAPLALAAQPEEKETLLRVPCEHSRIDDTELHIGAAKHKSKVDAKLGGGKWTL